MIIVIDIVLVLLVAIFLSIGYYVDIEGFCVAGVLFIIAAIIAVISTICIGVRCTNIKTLDSQIAVIEEQNTKIENEMATIVLSYEQYEKETFVSTKINSDDLDFIAIAEMYPDLKSNELVKNQIEVYKSNNERLTELKLEKAKGAISQWWLYFKPFN